MRAGEHLFEVGEVRHHGYDVVLDVAEVETDFTTGCHGVGFVAAFGEAFDYVCFSAEEAHEGHYFLAAEADLFKYCAEVFSMGDEDVVFDCVGFELDGMDGGAKGVDDVVDHGVADPVGGQGHVVAEFAYAFADVGCVWGLGVGNCKDAFAEDDHVDVYGLHVVFVLGVNLME